LKILPGLSGAEVYYGPDLNLELKPFQVHITGMKISWSKNGIPVHKAELMKQILDHPISSPTRNHYMTYYKTPSDLSRRDRSGFFIMVPFSWPDSDELKIDIIVGKLTRM